MLGAGSTQSEQRPRHFFEEAVTVPGSQHMLHNSTEDLHKCLPEWSVLFAKLKNFEDLLCIADYRRKLYVSCFKDTDLASQANMLLQTWSGTLYESRFREVLLFLREFRQYSHCWAKAGTRHVGTGPLAEQHMTGLRQQAPSEGSVRE